MSRDRLPCSSVREDRDARAPVLSARTDCKRQLGLAARIGLEHEQAVVDFAHLLRIDAHNTRARKDRGVSLLALGRYEEAIEEFTRGIESEPSLGLYIERGLAYVDIGASTQIRATRHAFPRVGTT